MKRILLIITLLFPIISHTKNTIYIVIHGTWADNSNWSKPGGDFYCTLQKNIGTSDRITSFRWSGSNSAEARERAAIRLSHTIASYQRETKIIVIAHSHGANVAIRASQLLHNIKQSPTIEIIFALGAPVTSNYIPNMNKIKYLYNLFSFEDMVQRVGGCFKREFSKHPRIANISVVIDGKEPGHSELHCPIISEWLSCLHTYLLHATKNPQKIFTQPGRIHFFRSKAPMYHIDRDHKRRTERDEELIKLFITHHYGFMYDQRNVTS